MIGLHRGPLAGALADMEDLVAQRLEDGPGGLEGGLGCRRHDGEGGLLRPRDAARDGRVHEAPTGLLDPVGDGLDGTRRAGRHQGHKGTFRQLAQRTALEQHGFRLGRVDHHEEEHVGPARGVGSRARPRPAGLLQGVEGAGPHVEASDLEAAGEQVAGHGGAHGPQADKADRAHGCSFLVIACMPPEQAQ